MREEGEQISHRDRIEAERLIGRVVRWAESAPDELETFTLRISDASPGVVALLQNTAGDLRKLAMPDEYPGTVDLDSYARRIASVFKQTGLSKSGLARMLDVPESSIYRWIQSREKGGTAPGYRHLEHLAGLAKSLGIPGSLLDDSCLQPMTVEILTSPEKPAENFTIDAGVKTPPSDKPLMVTFTSAAVRLLRAITLDPPYPP